MQLISTLKFLLISALLFTTVELFSSTSKYRLSLRGDAATTIVIGWSDDDASVGYGTVDHDQNFDAYPNKVIETQTVDKATKGMTHHFARLTGLQPDTVYYFAIKSADGHISPRISFHTAPLDGTGFSMVAGGDSRSRPDWRRKGNKLVAKLRPRAILFCGDYTVDDTAAQWQQWLNDWQYTRSPDGRMQPIVPVLGNHEYDDQVTINIFDAPAKYFSVNIGDVFVGVLNTEAENDPTGHFQDQENWLNNELANTTKSWRMVTYHKPMRTHGPKGDGHSVYNAFAESFHLNRVQLSIDGDTHVSKTTYPIVPDTAGEDGFRRDDASGTVYTGEGSWGVEARTYEKARSWTRRGGSFNQFKWIWVGQDQLTLRTVKFENEDNVAMVSDSNPYAVPAGISLFGSDIPVNKGSGAAPDPSGTITANISSGANDVEERIDGTLYVESSDLELVADGGDQHVGMRYSLDIPKGSVITSAKLRFIAKTSDSVATSLTIKGMASDNFPSFASTNPVSAPAKTAASVSWNPAATTAGAAFETPDISAIIEEIVGRSGWTHGSYVGLAIDGTGLRRAYSSEHGNGPELIVTYEADPMAVTPILDTGDIILDGEVFDLPSANAFLSLQSDGNMVFYSGQPGTPTGVIWATGVNPGNADYFGVMQGDGNLVVYNGVPGVSQTAIYSSGSTASSSDYFFGLRNDGVLVITDSQENQLWSHVKNRLYLGERLLENELLLDSTLNVFLIVQGDGNMVAYNGYGFDDPNKSSVWSSGSGGAGGDYFLNMQSDGNLVIYKGTALNPGEFVWASGSSASGEAYLTFDTDLLPAIKDANGNIVWKAP